LTLSLTPFEIVWLFIWSFFALPTAVRSWRRGESSGRAAVYGLAFPATWVIWFVEDNHRAGRKAFRSR
jgi:apolipoprotein N-acyltransferase